MDWNRDLEAVLRENPDDEAAWSILEDWTLERGGRRARILELGDAEQAQTEIWELEREVLGDEYGFLHNSAFFHWRAGYIVRCSIRATAGWRAAVIDRVLALPSAVLMRSFQVDIDAIDELAWVARRIAGTQIRELAINAFWKRATSLATFEPSWLAPTSIQRLQLFGRAIALPFGPELARLQTLWLSPGSPSDLRDLFAHPNGLPNLTELVVSLATLEHRHGVRAELFEHLFEAAPRLQKLTAREASPEFQTALAPIGSKVTLSFR